MAYYIGHITYYIGQLFSFQTFVFLGDTAEAFFKIKEKLKLKLKLKLTLALRTVEMWSTQRVVQRLWSGGGNPVFLAVHRLAYP